jgi:hypothetical protein
MHDCLVHLWFHGYLPRVLFLLVGAVMPVVVSCEGGAWGGVGACVHRSPLGRSQIVILLYVGVTAVTMGCWWCSWCVSSQIGICF